MDINPRFESQISLPSPTIQFNIIRLWKLEIVILSPFTRNRFQELFIYGKTSHKSQQEHLPKYELFVNTASRVRAKNGKFLRF